MAPAPTAVLRPCTVYTAVIGYSVFTQSSTGYPNGLAVDANGTLWVADGIGCRVLRFDHASAKANGAAADGVLGQSAFTTNTPSCPPTSASMGGPSGLTVDASGTLWVADLNNNRVLRFDTAASKANGAPADAVLGQPDFTSNFSSDKRSGMGFPAAVALSASGDLFVVEALNGRVTRFTPKPDPVSPPSPPASAPTIGVAGKKNLSTSQASVVLKGTAASSDGVARVEYRVGKGSLRTASGDDGLAYQGDPQAGPEYRDRRRGEQWQPNVRTGRAAYYPGLTMKIRIALLLAFTCATSFGAAIRTFQAADVVLGQAEFISKLAPATPERSFDERSNRRGGGCDDRQSLRLGYGQ